MRRVMTKALVKLCVKLASSYPVSSSVVNDEGSKPEIISRTAQTTEALTGLKPTWKDNKIALQSKVYFVLLQ